MVVTGAQKQIVLALWLATRIAAAQSDPAEAEYHRAGELRSSLHLADALTIYQRLHDATHAPRALAQIGVTEAQMGRWLVAEEHLVMALATRDGWVERNRPQLQSALDQTRQHLGTLTVACRVPNAELFVGGVSVGRLPRSAMRLPLGTAVIDVAAEGYEGHRETVQVGSSTQVEVTLVRRAGVVASPPVPPTEAVATQDPVAPQADVRVDPPRAAAHSPMPRTLAWTSGAAGLAFLGVGIATYVVGDGAATRWNSDQCLAPGVTRETTCGDERSTAETMGTLATVGFVGAGLLGAASTVLFVTSGGSSGERSTPRASWGCGPGPGRIGLSCGGRF
jgi:hypothetical protein